MIRLICGASTLMMLTCTTFTNATANTEDKIKKAKRAFLQQIPRNLEKAERFLEAQGMAEPGVDLRGMPDGELLIFNLEIPPRLLVDGLVFSEVYEGHVLLSLRDFISALALPIEYNEETQTYSGWFIREENIFTADLQNGTISAKEQNFKLGAFSQTRDDDILAPVQSFEQWFDIEMNVDVGVQRISISPKQPFPATERFDRRQKNYKKERTSPAELPLKQDDYDIIAVPVADISTRSSAKRNVDGETTTSHNLNIRTAGEFARGALNTNLAFTDKDNLSSARFNYLQESSKPELLGKLKARRLEAGDIIPTRLPLTGSSAAEAGIRITNADPLNNVILPSTQITGYFFPEWDVELYRDSTLLNFQQTDQEGFYNFDNIALLSDRNVFRIVGYGPQGEMRERTLSVPYDRNRLAKEGAIYDVSVTMQERQIYERLPTDDQDADTLHAVGFVEFPLAGGALRIGARHRQEEGNNKLYTNVAMSNTIKQALVNTEIAADEQGEFSAALSATREFGQHRTRADISFASDNYNPGQNNSVIQTFASSLNFDGPLKYFLGDSPRYSGSFQYNQDTDNTKNMNGFFGVNTQFGRIGYNQIANFSDTNADGTDQEIGTTTTITGSYGRNIIRFLANYSFRPKSELETLAAFWKRNITKTVEGQVQVNRSLDDKLTRYSAQLNWRPKQAVITPRLSYSDEGEVEAVLSTRFSLAKVPQDSKIFVTNEPLTNSGSLSAFVYLDKNGDEIFNEDDEPIEEVKVLAPQNSGGSATNKNGVAYISHLRPNLITDVYVVEASLPDPYWITARKGVSVMPRTGDSISLEFPIHISGEIDGTILKSYESGYSEPFSRAILELYNVNGQLQDRTSTGPDGYYAFSLIPPGEYLLIMTGKNVPKDFGRPLPKNIKVGYDGTIIYGQDIIIKQSSPDVDVRLLSNKNTISNDGVSMNLGTYNSSLMMAYSWSQLVKNYSATFGGGSLLKSPVNNKDDTINKEHTLRIVFKHDSLKSTHKRCQILVSHGHYCSLDIYPSAL